MFDLELLQTFVSVVDAGGFTRAGEQVNRTQSTVSQQIRKLEEQAARPLLVRHRASRSIQLTEDGERLLGYARRLIGLANEARYMMTARDVSGVVSLGMPEDFPTERLVALLVAARERLPDIRLDTCNGLSVQMHSMLERKELDLALVKRNATGEAAIARWDERLEWVCGAEVDLAHGPLPLIVYHQGCLYRERAVRCLEAAGRPWRIAFASQSLASIQAAVSAGLGVSLLPASAVLPGQRIVTGQGPFSRPPSTELALLASSKLLTRVQQQVVDFLVGALEG
ncbi:LysR substrate-binding domain-containing protein [Pseudomonas entomophila]|uniref:LysR substrate-binding domain-containing protein n=1 Tax=Pseudomonas entomophila TaxID=312306 RepID=UPI0023D895B7|nr:LysR substrate-binding domain-containing protein [Pseudomonas entomophila]MDF0733118.1 LysR substrate-binding domain-containing protein [Pseudomonas entomophila]